VEVSITPVDIAGGGMDTENLTWRDKVAIMDVTARIALGMFLALAVFCELLVVVHG
jgi:hypothetical protein